MRRGTILGAEQVQVETIRGAILGAEQAQEEKRGTILGVEQVQEERCHTRDRAGTRRYKSIRFGVEEILEEKIRRSR